MSCKGIRAILKIITELMSFLLLDNGKVSLKLKNQINVMIYHGLILIVCLTTSFHTSDRLSKVLKTKPFTVNTVGNE